jgi:hypothetical protein
MKLKNVKVGESYIIKSLANTIVGNLPHKVGDVVVVRKQLLPWFPHTVQLDGGYGISHLDLKRIKLCKGIDLSHPLAAFVGKTVEVLDAWVMSDGKDGMRGVVVGHDGSSLIVDFGNGFDGNNAGGRYHKKTCNFLRVCNVKFVEGGK